jgi:hypothetical protein
MNQGWPRGGGGPPKGEGDTFLNWGLGSPRGIPRTPCVLVGGRLENLAVYGLHYSQKKSHYITLQPEKVGLHYITGPKSHITLHYRRPL